MISYAVNGRYYTNHLIFLIWGVMCHNENALIEIISLDINVDEASYPFAGFSEDGSIIAEHVVTDPHIFIPTGLSSLSKISSHGKVIHHAWAK